MGKGNASPGNFLNVKALNYNFIFDVFRRQYTLQKNIKICINTMQFLYMIVIYIYIYIIFICEIQCREKKISGYHVLIKGTLAVDSAVIGLSYPAYKYTDPNAIKDIPNPYRKVKSVNRVQNAVAWSRVSARVIPRDP